MFAFYRALLGIVGAGSRPFYHSSGFIYSVLYNSFLYFVVKVTPLSTLRNKAAVSKNEFCRWFDRNGDISMYY